MTGTGRAAASLWLAAAFLVLTAIPSSALLQARSTPAAQHVLTSANWGLVARAAATDTTFAPLTLSGITDKNRLYFSLVNTGGLALVGGTLVLQVTATKGSPTASFKTCSTTWDETGDKCPGGTIATLLTAPYGNSSDPLTFSLAVGASLRVQVSSSPNGPEHMQVVISASVSSASPRQIRPATVTSG